MSESGESSEVRTVGEKARLEVVMFLGQHRIAEHIAFKVGNRLRKFTALGKTAKLEFHEHDQGLCYIDAYESAKAATRDEGTEISSPRFSKILEKETDKRQTLARKRSFETAIGSPGTIVFDLHESTFLQEPENQKEDGIEFLVNLPKEKIDELNRDLGRLFPQADTLGAHQPLMLRAFQITNAQNGETIPLNYVAIEIKTMGGEIYDPVALKEGALSIGYAFLNTGIVRPKEPQDTDDLAGKLRIAGKIDAEVTKYVRLLEYVLPTVINFFQSEGLLPQSKQTTDREKNSQPQPT